MMSAFSRSSAQAVLPRSVETATVGAILGVRVAQRTVRPAMTDAERLSMIRGVHTAIYIVMAVSTFVLVYAGVTGETGIWLWGALSLLAVETVPASTAAKRGGRQCAKLLCQRLSHQGHKPLTDSPCIACVEMNPICGIGFGRCGGVEESDTLFGCAAPVIVGKAP